MALTTLSDDAVAAICDRLHCTECSERGVNHLIEFRGVRIVLLGFCDPCWEKLGGEQGCQAILAHIIRQRELVRRN